MIKQFLNKNYIKALLAVVLMLSLVGCNRGLPPNEVEHPDDIDGRIIGAIRGSPSVRLASERGILWVEDTGEQLMERLRIGDVDTVLMESFAASSLVSATSGVRILPYPLIEYELRFAVPRENTQLLQVINTTLETLEANGTLNGLRSRYFGGRNFVYVPPEDVTPTSRYLTLAVPPEAYPFSFRDEQGGLSGLSVYVARAITDILGVELRFVELDPADLITAVWHGRADFAVGWLPDDLGDVVNVSEPYAQAEHSIIVRR
jgi:polar amino acid transport system substrate-binding protein